MFKNNKVAAIAILASLLLATAPAMFLAQGQIQTAPAQQVVALAEKASQQVQNLINWINSDDDALAQIETVGLTDEFNENVTLFATGFENLEAAETALENSENENAVASALEALRIFREVYISIHVIMNTAGLQQSDLIESQGLLEAITRELQRVDRLREILPTDVPENIRQSLDTAETLLGEARTQLLAGDITDARTTFLDAENSISEVYQYLKEEAETLNTWRLNNYCAGLQERISERFRYGQQQGIDFTSVLESYGYQNESQFMEALQNRTQTALNEQNFEDAIQDSELAGQMVQQMEQALNQEINRHQGMNGPGSGGSGSGSGYGGNGP
jgi:hypothetical protein